MKNFMLLVCLSLMMLPFCLLGSTGECASAYEEEDWRCSWNCSFKGIRNGGKYQLGQPLYIKCEPKRHHRDIEFVELHVDGKLVRKESRFPYEWGKGNSDGSLRKLKKGKHVIVCKIKDRCGDWHRIYCKIWIEGGKADRKKCAYQCWFKSPKQGQQYRVGEAVYVNVDCRGRDKIEKIDLWCGNKYIRNETNYPFEWGRGNNSSDGYLRKLPPGQYTLRCMVRDDCGGSREYHRKFVVGGGYVFNNPLPEQKPAGSHCIWESAFKYPRPFVKRTYPSSMYVEVATRKFRDIQYMELWCDGKYIGKDHRSPFQWGKGKRSYQLNKLRPGQHLLKCKIVDVCGNAHWQECRFTVGGR